MHCLKEYASSLDADRCLREHDLIYMPISAEDLNSLHLFLYFKDESILSESLIKTIKKYARIAARRQMNE